MALSGADFGTPQFYRSSFGQVVQQKSLLQQSKELSAAVGALESPTVTVTPARNGPGMATLCLVQSDDSYSSGSLNSAISAYTTVLSD